MDPKLYVASADGDIHVLEQYDIHVQLTPKKNTILHVVAQFGQADCVKWILQLPSPSLLLQQPNEKGDTPLHLAAKEGNLAMVKNLIAAAKQLQEGDMERGGTAVCKVMLRMKNEDKDIALHEAVRYHHPEVVKLLIQEDLEFTYGANTEGNTPLYISAEWGFRDLVQMILDNCSSPAHSGINDRTSLHASVILNHQGSGLSTIFFFFYCKRKLFKFIFFIFLNLFMSLFVPHFISNDKEDTGMEACFN